MLDFLKLIVTVPVYCIIKNSANIDEKPYCVLFFHGLYCLSKYPAIDLLETFRTVTMVTVILKHNF